MRLEVLAMEYLVRIRGSFNLGEFPVSSAALNDMAAFYRRRIEAASPDEAARLALDAVDQQRSSVNELWVSIGDGEWMVYDQMGALLRVEKDEDAWTITCAVCDQSFEIPFDKAPPDVLPTDRVIAGMFVPNHPSSNDPDELCEGGGRPGDVRRAPMAEQ
jgi:hypothetical protein